MVADECDSQFDFIDCTFCSIFSSICHYRQVNEIMRFLRWVAFFLQRSNYVFFALYFPEIQFRWIRHSCWMLLFLFIFFYHKHLTEEKAFTNRISFHLSHFPRVDFGNFHKEPGVGYYSDFNRLNYNKCETSNAKRLPRNWWHLSTPGGKTVPFSRHWKSKVQLMCQSTMSLLMRLGKREWERKTNIFDSMLSETLWHCFAFKRTLLRVFSHLNVIYIWSFSTRSLSICPSHAAFHKTSIMRT